MGVDFLICDICHESFPDCGDFVSCDCGGRFCSSECAQIDDCVYDEDGEPVEDEDGDFIIGEETCVLCRGEALTDQDLIEFLLKKLSLTREQAVELFNNEE